MAGRYCGLGREGPCPKALPCHLAVTWQGHFCPFGTQEPKVCPLFTSCRGPAKDGLSLKAQAQKAPKHPIAGASASCCSWPLQVWPPGVAWLIP